MEISQAAFTPDQQAFLEWSKELGVVVDTAVLRCNGDDLDMPCLLKAAAVRGMEIFTNNSYTQSFFAEKSSGIVEPIGEQITFQEFVGDGVNLSNGALDLFAYDPNNSVIAIKAHDGLAYALLCPPLSLEIEHEGSYADADYVRSETEALTKVLIDYLGIMLGLNGADDIGDVVIYKWSCDWSSYFDSGSVWWGTFYWTIYHRKTNLITVIGASTSD